MSSYGFFKFIGAMAVFGGLAGYYKAYLQREKRKQADVPSGTYGEARFATLEDCEAAGLLDPHGIYLGLLDGQPLFFKGKAHIATVGPARSGKGVGIVFPGLFHSPDSMAVSDMKGELAAVTAKHRAERFGHKIIIFNPWGLHDLPQHRINPLQSVIELASDPRLQRGLMDEVKAIALELYPEPEDSRNRYFREGSRSILRAVLAYLALERPQQCSLPEMWRIIASPRRLTRAIEDMSRSDALFGLLADLGDNLGSQIDDNPDQFADFLAGALQVLDPYQPGSYCGDAMSGSDIALDALKREPVTIYLVIPQERITTHGPALGLIINRMITAIARSDGKRKVLFVLDEFANLGKLSGLAESLTALPGLGVRVWMIVQELAELVRIYGPHTATTILSQAEVQQFLAVREIKLAKRLAEAMGQMTVKTVNFNLGRFDDDEVGQSLSESGQLLMRPEKIMQMGKYDQLLFVTGLPPIKAQRIPFWFIQPWGRWAAPNPVEGGYPIEPPVVELSYERKGSDHERV
ncbi:type IV secretory system conjugative DNA transfer family protein [Hoeflea sp.]|uniref:type IV secretory system conjugative DNA transfer family protein n=1 Tax=Hoeflea sp. TaxID=1940281 RepID=UPI003B02290D